MFELATRLKLRFNFKGLCTVEDLWDLSVQNLDKIFKELNRELKTQEEESLLTDESDEKKALELKVKIIKHIVAAKIEEAKAKELKAQNAAKKQQILAIIAEKENQSLKDMPMEDLKALVKDM